MLAIGYIDVFLALFFKNVKVLKMWWVVFELFNFKVEKIKTMILPQVLKIFLKDTFFCPMAKNENWDETRYIPWQKK